MAKQKANSNQMDIELRRQRALERIERDQQQRTQKPIGSYKAKQKKA